MYPPVPVYLPAEPPPPRPLDDASRGALGQGTADERAHAARVIIDTMDDYRLDALPLADQLLLGETLADAGFDGQGDARTPAVRLLQAIRLPESFLNAEARWARQAGDFKPPHPLNRKDANAWSGLTALERQAALDELADTMTGARPVTLQLSSWMPEGIKLKLYALDTDGAQPVMQVNSHPDGVLSNQAESVCAVVDMAARLRQQRLIARHAADPTALSGDAALAARVLTLSNALAKASNNPRICASLPGSRHLKTTVGAAFARMRPVWDDVLKFLGGEPHSVRAAIAEKPARRYLPAPMRG